MAGVQHQSPPFGNNQLISKSIWSTIVYSLANWSWLRDSLREAVFHFSVNCFPNSIATRFRIHRCVDDRATCHRRPEVPDVRILRIRRNMMRGRAEQLDMWHSIDDNYSKTVIVDNDDI